MHYYCDEYQLAWYRMLFVTAACKVRTKKKNKISDLFELHELLGVLLLVSICQVSPTVYVQWHTMQIELQSGKRLEFTEILDH